MNKQDLLNVLPPFDANYELITDDQDVDDIIREVLDAHEVFADDYDRIALFFDKDNADNTCKTIMEFCKKNFFYSEQTREKQMTMSPAAMMSLSNEIDCKNYAGFCGGILDAINREKDEKIHWCYRFASYKILEAKPHHVFVVVNPGKNELWFDPTPGSDRKRPVWQIDKKINVKPMALYRVSGIGDTNNGIVQDYAVSDLLEQEQNNQPLYMAIQLLLKYGVMNVNAQVNDKVLTDLEGNISPDMYQQLIEARRLVEMAAIGSFFGDLWHGVKAVSLAAPRNAFLGLVALNVFGYATKLSNMIYQDDNVTYEQPGQDKVYTVWHKLGGNWNGLLNAVLSGRKKKAILGNTDTIGVAQAAIPAWLTIAAAVIAAVMPLVNAYLKAKQQQTGIDYTVDPTTGLPYSIPPQESNLGFFDSIVNFAQANPLLVIGAAVGISYIRSHNK